MAINFPTSLDSLATAVDNTTDVMAADINDVRRICEALEAKVGIASSAVDTTLDYKVNNFFVENVRKLLFYENTTPTGWTIENTLDDKVVFITKGSVAGGLAGGIAHATGTWTQPNHTHSVPTLYLNKAGAVGYAVSNTVFTADGTWNMFTSTGGGGGTCYQVNAYTDAGTSGNGATANTWRPASYNCIIGKYTGA